MDVDVAATVGAGLTVAGAIGAGWKAVHRSLFGQVTRQKNETALQLNGLRVALEADMERHRRDIDTKLADMDSELDAYNRNAQAFRVKVMDRFEQMPTRAEMREDMRTIHTRFDELLLKLGTRHD